MQLAPLTRLGAVALVAALAACTAPSGNVVSANQSQTASTVAFGTIVSARNVAVQGGQGSQLAGALIGGLAGAALGNEVGGGTGKTLATGVGATAGAAAGMQAGQAAGGHQSIEWTVRLENGQTIAVIQAEPVFSVGQRVQVISGGGQTRLAAA